MSRFPLVAGGAFLLSFAASALVPAEVGCAQSQSLFGGRGTTNASTQSRSTGSRTSTSGSMFGQSSFGANSGGRTSGQTPGQSMLGGMDLLNGMGILNNQSLSGNSSLVGNGFVGRSNNPQDFVGRRAANGTSGAGANRQGRNLRSNPRNFRGQQGRNNNQNANDENSNAMAQRQQTVRLMARQRIAFDQPALPSSAVETKLNDRFDESMKKRLDAKDLNFNLDGSGVLTMRGLVRTAEEKDLAEMIARMEPGVQDVRNELTVTTPAAP